MIQFERLQLARRAEYDLYLQQAGRGCGYSFANLYIWGRQRAAFVGDFLTFFSQFNRQAVYPFPVGQGDVQPILDAIVEDARQRGIPCCITGMTEADCRLLEQLYPGRFRFHDDRDSYDYIYSIDDLADLKGRNFQKKRNHLNRFLEEHPNFQTLPLNENTRAAAFCMAQQWYAQRYALDPTMDFHLESNSSRIAAFVEDVL
mgnify:CR=1 FL=1